VGEVVQASLGLALGLELDTALVADWPRLFAAAYAERIASLAWLRSGDFIRKAAPPDTIARWRSQVIATDLYAQEQWQALRRLVNLLESAGVRACVLKGLPLAHALYGHVGVRQCCDIDLFVAVSERRVVGHLLQTLGWSRWVGEAPFDEGYQLVGNDTTLFLEIHSILPGEALAHCRIEPIEDAVVVIDNTSVRTLTGPALIVYLAGNIAKHGFVPLLSYIDVAEIWERMDLESRQKAFRIAKRAGLSRCFSWTLARSGMLVEAALGSRKALRLLGVGERVRSSVHALLRLTWLSDNPVDAARVLGTWTWPRSLRKRPRELPGFWGRRVQRPIAGRFLYRRDYELDSMPVSSRVLPRSSRGVRGRVPFDHVGVP
jgi:hypothetical protein